MTAIIIILIYHYLLISIVLFEPVECEDLEACDVEHGDEVGLLQAGVDESVVTLRRKSINLSSCCCLKLTYI